MYERSKKPTLEQIRTLFPFDPAVLAEQAGLSTTGMYYALVMRPILRKDAEKILAALSTHTGLPLTLEQVELVTWEEFDLLWVVRACANGEADQGREGAESYDLVYARDQEHAAHQAREWLAHRPHLPHHFFTPCPAGLRVGNVVVPGRRQVACSE